MKLLLPPLALPPLGVACRRRLNNRGPRPRRPSGSSLWASPGSRGPQGPSEPLFGRDRDKEGEEKEIFFRGRWKIDVPSLRLPAGFSFSSLFLGLAWLPLSLSLSEEINGVSLSPRGCSSFLPETGREGGETESAASVRACVRGLYSLSALIGRWEEREAAGAFLIGPEESLSFLYRASESESKREREFSFISVWQVRVEKKIKRKKRGIRGKSETPKKKRFEDGMRAKTFKTLSPHPLYLHLSFPSLFPERK